jgi:predicted secreted protein
MNLTGGIVLFAVIWFMVFFCVLPVRFKSQAEAGEIVPGTPASAPADAQIGRKARITTAITVVLWAVIAYVILSGMVSIYDLDWFGRLTPPQD